MLQTNTTKIIQLLFFIAVCFWVSGTAKAETCEELKEKYYTQDKKTTLSRSKGAGDDSAIRETNRELERVGFLLEKLIILQFMERQKCESPPAVAKNYWLEGLSCSTARLQVQLGKRDSANPECDISKWKATEDR